MSRKKHVSETPATAWLRARGISFQEHSYDYVPHGGALQGARELGLDAHRVVKTIVLEDDGGHALIVLMHGDRRISTKQLARQIEVKRVHPCDPQLAQHHTGYLVGGTSPFGTREDLPVYIESSVLDFDRIAINGGKRGYLIELAPQVCVQHLGAKPVQCAISL